MLVLWPALFRLDPADGYRTPRGRVSDGFNPHDRSVECGDGRVDGYRGSSIPPPSLAASMGERSTFPRDRRAQPRPSTIRSYPESSEVSYKIHSGSLREGSRQSGVNRTQPEPSGAIRSSTGKFRFFVVRGSRPLRSTLDCFHHQLRIVANSCR
jgi:hypothetical protein